MNITFNRESLFSFLLYLSYSRMHHIRKKGNLCQPSVSLPRGDEPGDTASSFIICAPIGPNMRASSLMNGYRKATFGKERNIVKKKGRHLNRAEGFIRKWVSLFDDMTDTPHVSFLDCWEGSLSTLPVKRSLWLLASAKVLNTNPPLGASRLAGCLA
jgi:hypothetical protein